MSDDLKRVIGAFASGLSLGVLFSVVFVQCLGTHSAPYMQGQVDAQTGNVHWSLKDNPDGTREWKHD